MFKALICFEIGNIFSQILYRWHGLICSYFRQLTRKQTT